MAWLPKALSTGAVRQVGPALLQAAIARQPRQMDFGLDRHGSANAQTSNGSVLALPVGAGRWLRRTPSGISARRAAVAVGLTSVVDLGLAGLARCDRRVPRASRRWTGSQALSDAIWDASRSLYGALTRRDAAALHCLCRPGDKRMIHRRFSRDGRCLGVDRAEYARLRRRAEFRRTGLRHSR